MKVFAILFFLAATFVVCSSIDVEHSSTLAERARAGRVLERSSLSGPGAWFSRLGKKLKITKKKSEVPKGSTLPPPQQDTAQITESNEDTATETSSVEPPKVKKTTIASPAPKPKQDSIEHDQLDTLIAIGDVHGDLHNLQKILRAAGIISDSNAWEAEATTGVLFTGDMVDRGPDDKGVLDFITGLKKAHPKQVFLGMGNHDMMVVTNKMYYSNTWGYECPKPLDSFKTVDSKSKCSRCADAQYHRQSGNGAAGDVDTCKSFFDQLDKAEILSCSGDYHKKIVEMPPMNLVGNTIFMHGGLSEQWMNKLLGGQDKSPKLLNAKLVVEGYNKGVKDAIQAQCEYFDKKLLGQDATAPAASEYLASSGPASPVWERKFSKSPTANCDELGRVLTKLGLDMMVVGHTRVNGIQHACNGKVFMIDSKISTGFHKYETTEQQASLKYSGLYYLVLQQGSKPQTVQVAVDSTGKPTADVVTEVTDAPVVKLH